jgi:hypothetical protein
VERRRCRGVLILRATSSYSVGHSPVLLLVPSIRSLRAMMNLPRLAGAPADLRPHRSPVIEKHDRAPARGRAERPDPSAVCGPLGVDTGGPAGADPVARRPGRPSPGR